MADPDFDQPERDEIDHSYTDEIICPFCGCEQSDSWEYGRGEEGDLGKIECAECEKELFGCRNIQVTYSTMKPCDTCGKPLREFLDEGSTCRRCPVKESANG